MNRISKANRPKSSIIERRATRPLSERNPALADKISQMCLAISPIYHAKTNRPAPDYPYTMLSLFLLTEDQLDALGHYYNQIIPDQELTYEYGVRMRWDEDFLSKDQTLPENCRLTARERLEIKMRMFAHFAGIQGTDTPLWEAERFTETFSNKIRRRIRNEEMSLDKWYRGPMKSPR